jgi:SPP1 gp7 family putative phage head morphogenesis protein
MTIASKLNEADKLTDKAEEAMLAELNRIYTNGYKETRKLVADFIAKYGIDGAMDPVEALKFKRAQSLEREMLSIVAELNTGAKKAIDNLAIDTWMINYYHAGFALESELQVKLAYTLIPRDAVRKAIANPLDKLALADNADLVKRRLRRDIASSIAQGDSIEKMAGKVRNSLERNANDAVRIARTETTRVMNEARLESFQKAVDKGIKMQKVWVATLDGRTRDRHQDLDGEKRDIDKPFSNGLMEPGDYSGPPEEVINCRCTMITELKDYPTEAAYRRDNVTKEVIPYQKYDDWFDNRVKERN